MADEDRDDLPEEDVPDEEEEDFLEGEYDVPSKHLPTERSDKDFYFCEICRKKFINYGSYRRHLRMHFCNKKYSCTICGRQFFRRYLWLKHQEKFHGDTLTSYDCPHCDMKLKTFDTLKEHLKSKHRRIHSMQELFSVPPSMGDKPQQETAEGSGDANGEASEVKPQQYACDVCGRKFQRRFQWLKHLESHNPRVTERLPRSNAHSPEPLTCGDCGFECETLAELEVHRKEDHRTLDTGTGTSRYGRRIKQRVLYNSDSYLQSPKRTRRSSKIMTQQPEVSSPPPVPEIQSTPILSCETLKALVSAPSFITNSAITITPVTVSTTASPSPVVISTPVMSVTPMPPVSTKGLLQKNQRGTFFCEKCRRVFINKSSYLRHKKMHTGVKPFTCEFCCLSFFRSESLNTHKKKHADDPLDYRCYACGYKAANSASLRNHYYTTCSKERASSENAPQQKITTFSNVAILNTSERDIAGFCAICNRAFFNNSNYQRHMQQHAGQTHGALSSETGGGSYHCVVCNQWFTDYHLYDEHSRKAHANNKGWDDDSACNDDLFSVPFDSRQEVKAENGMNGTIIMCKLCPMAFTTRTSYDAHVTTHAPSWLEFCSYCGNPFKSKKELVAHERTCYMVCTCEDRMYSCYQCGAYCESSSTLKDHVLNTHVPSASNGSAASASTSVRSAVVKKELVEDEVKAISSEPKESGVTELPPQISSLSDDVEIVALNVIDASPKIKEEPAATKSCSSRHFKCGQCEKTFTDMPAVFEHCRKVHETSSSSSVPKTVIQPVVRESSKTGLTALLQNGPSSCTSNLSSANSIMKQLLSSPPAFHMANNGSSALPSSPPPPVHNCSLCHKSFTDKVAMERHEQLAHVMIDWYKCTICEKSGSQVVMERHMLTHMFKIGSMVTTSERAEVEDLDGPSEPETPPQFFSVFCQICKKIFSSFQTLGHHQHIETNSLVSQPFVCCMPNCGDSFATTEDVTGHLQNDHSSSQWNVEKVSKEPVASFSPWKPESASWKHFSDVVSRKVKDDDSFPDIYQMSDEEIVGGMKDLDEDFDIEDIDADVEEIMVEPLLDLAGEAKQAQEGGSKQADDLEAEDVDDDSKRKQTLKCHKCDSVFTNLCSWKRHCKLHLGIMKHTCPHCLRMFYRKDHCDKHIRTHTRQMRKLRPKFNSN